MTGDNDDVDQARRDVLRGAGKGLATVVGSAAAVGAVSRRVAASHADHTPTHVSDPAFDETLLEQYKPRLIIKDLDVEPSSIHGAVFRSTLEDATVLTYWTEYPVQLDRSGFASHIGDREPFYVYLQNEGTADEYIDRVVATGYHWLALERADPPTDDGTDTGRPRAYVAPQYHHYSLDTAESDPRDGVDLTLKDLRDSLPRWLADGEFHDALAEDWNDRGSPAYNPYLMRDKASWWREEGLSNYEHGVRSFWLHFGFRGASSSDLK